MGRPRSFDEGEALDKAMRVFWKKGYDSTSISDLVEAMGLNPPSLYAAFGNKEAVFLRVMERYAEGPAAYVLEALEAPTAREVAEHRLHGAVEAMCDTSRPFGCLAAQAVGKCGDASSEIAQKLIRDYEGVHAAYVARFQRAKDEGDLPPDADPELLARYIDTLVHGLSTQAVTGASQEELRSVVNLALRQWPG